MIVAIRSDSDSETFINNMCGFVGMIGLNGARADARVIDRMSAVLGHRGPDAEASYVSNAVGFGFRRLSILDLSPTGQQPMLSPDGQSVLVFNGEIYNYLELRQELETLGHNFKSTGDTEVLLHAYLEWGSECVTRFNGMWSFLIYDLRRRKLFGSRDRFGKKPLYRYRRGDYVFFASEIKAIIASGYYNGSPNWSVISKFLLINRLDESDETFYSDIERVPAGSVFDLDLNGQLHQRRFWSLANLSNFDVASPVEQFSEIFEDAVRLRLRSDVPVGIFLSGGLDSTSVLCTLTNTGDNTRERTHNPLMAFAYQTEEYDETSYIKDTITQTGAKLISVKPDPSRLWEILDKVLWFQDEPVHGMSAVVSFELSRLAAENGIKVILSGAGSDESLAGYPNYFQNYWFTVLRERGLGELWREISAYCVEHGGSPSEIFLRSLYDQVKSELAVTATYKKLARIKTHRMFQKHSWYTPAIWDYLDLKQNDYGKPTIDTALKQSLERSPLPLYLRIDDRNTMAHSIELRTPFLDYRLVTLAFQLPAHWKMRGPWNKFVLRQAMHNRIPESVRTRVDKMGFPVPSKTWFANGLYEPMKDLLSSREVRERGIYNVDVIHKDVELHRQGKSDLSSRLFNLAQFEIWSTLSKTQVTKQNTLLRPTQVRQ